MFDIILTLIADIVGAVRLDYGSVLNTKKIDANIEMLKKEDWFRRIFEDERYHRLFFVNRQVRAYLQSTYRAKRLARNRKAREKFIDSLDSYLKR